jgi:hypothetical protein
MSEFIGVEALVPDEEPKRTRSSLLDRATLGFVVTPAGGEVVTKKKGVA